jgi:hypothetical protein
MTDPRRRFQVRRYVKGTDPKTPGQLACRQNMRIAIYEWRSLSHEDQQKWRILGRRDRLPGYHKFLSFRLKGL